MNISLIVQAVEVKPNRFGYKGKVDVELVDVSVEEIIDQIGRDILLEALGVK